MKADFFLRVGLAITFLYVGIASFMDPISWIGFVPGFIEIIISAEKFLYIHSIFNVILALLLLFNKKIFYVANVSAVYLFGITVFNIGAIDIVFRDIGLFFMAVALVILSKKS